MAATSLLQILPWKRKPTPVANTPTHNPQQAAQVLTVPTYREHLQDLYTNRQSQTSKQLLEALFVSDPDTSAAVSSYLTMADTDPLVFVRDANGQLDPDGHTLVQQIMMRLSRRLDYTLGFQLKPSIREHAELFRHMILLRGACAGELVVDKTLIPTDVRHVDPGDLRWYEKKPGEYKPVQLVSGTEVSLDVPTFYVNFYRRSPKKIYPDSPFVAAINTIAARTQVINDLYRIMNVTGYPRIDVSVLEEVIRKSAPATARTDASVMRNHIQAEVSAIQRQFAQIRPDQAFVHTDAVEAKVINDKSPSVGMNVESIIAVLNAQNQAGLKTMATLLGRGSAGVNTGTVEARVMSMQADALNKPVAEMLSNLLSMALHLMGRPSFVELRFRPAELRPATELEPMQTVKQNRLLDALSYGTITDEEYHLEMHGRPPPKGSPTLSGTMFRQPAPAAGGEGSDPSPNSDPLGRSVTPDGSEAAKSKGTRAGG